MRFMLIGRYENGLVVLVGSASSPGVGGNGKRHTDAQYPKR